MKSREEIEQFLIDYIAQYADIEPEDIDVNSPWEAFGLDSASAIELSGDLSDWSRLDIDPMMMYDYPSILALSLRLSDEW